MAAGSKQAQATTGIMVLPAARLESGTSVEAALQRRRSAREFAQRPLDLAEAAQLLWAAQGTTGIGSGRTCPSAGALYPLEACLIASEVEGLSKGVYRYQTKGHRLLKVIDADVQAKLASASLNQECVARAPALIVLSAVYDRVTRKYGDRGVRYAYMEAGHAAENVCLQAAALNLGVVVVGAFEDSRVKQLLQMPNEEDPLYIIPAGRVPGVLDTHTQEPS